MSEMTKPEPEFITLRPCGTCGKSRRNWRHWFLHKFWTMPDMGALARALAKDPEYLREEVEMYGYYDEQ